MVVPSPARLADADRPAQRLDVRAHHVQPDAAAGEIGDRCRGGEARLEDEARKRRRRRGALGRRRGRARARAPRCRPRSRPAPSSDELDHDRARLVDARGARPCRRGPCPAASRAAGASIPWSTALRIMWVSGSRRCSITVRVDLDVAALEHQAGLLAAGGGHVAHRAGVAAGRRARSGTMRALHDQRPAGPGTSRSDLAVAPPGSRREPAACRASGAARPRAMAISPVRSSMRSSLAMSTRSVRAAAASVGRDAPARRPRPREARGHAASRLRGEAARPAA